MSKEAKAALKAARDEIRAKNFSAAAAKCRDVLKWEPANYNALVMLGAAAQELSDYGAARDALRRAADSAPDQLTAWQGLRAFYEAAREKAKEFYDAKEHVAVSSKLVSLLRAGDDAGKACDAALRLAEVHLRLDERREALKVLESVLDDVPDGSEHKALLWQKTVEILKYYESPTEEDDNRIADGLRYLVRHRKTLPAAVSTPDLGDHERLLRTLVRRGRFEDAAAAARVTTEVFPKAVLPIELLCRMYVEKTVRGELVDVDAVLNHVGREKSSASASPWFHLARGCRQFYTAAGDLQKARDDLERGLRRESSVQAMLVYAKVLLELKDDCGAYHVLSRAAQDFQSTGDSAILDDFNVLLIKAMIGSGQQSKLESAKALLQSIPEESQDAETRLRLYLGLKEWKKAAVLLTEIPDSEEKTFYEFRISRGGGDNESARCSLEKIVNSEAASAQLKIRGLLGLGELEEEGGGAQSTRALSFYLQAAKLDQNDPAPFARLGRFYLASGDLDRATKCYARALALNPRDVEVAAGLADCRLRRREYPEAASVLEPICDALGLEEAEDVWFRLAVVRLHQDRAGEAVQLLQRVIRCDPENAVYWEFLGDAYAARGAFNSAFKSYSRAFDLNPASVYSAWSCGEILKIRKEFTEAKVWFDKALSLNPDYLPAVVSAGQSLLGKAQSFKDQILDARARDFVEQGLVLADRALALRVPATAAAAGQTGASFVAVRKLAADLCALCAGSMDPEFRLLVPARLVNPNSRRRDAELTGGDAADLALNLYVLVARAAPDSAEAWMDVGLALEARALGFHRDDGPALLAQAVKVYGRALKLNPKLPAAWNNLGVLLCRSDVTANFRVSKESMAQHCFIQSIRLDPRIATPWFNLGVFYMQRGEMELSNKAMANAQVCDPDNVNAWVGMALMSEKLADASTSVDLFRHSAQLCFHPESALFYAKWVLAYLLHPDPAFRRSEEYRMQIDVLHAVSKAHEGLVHYVRRRPGNPVAHLALGQLCERQGLWSQARAAFASAARLVSSGTCAEAWGQEESLLSRLNFHAGRCCLRLGQVGEALELLKSVGAPTLRTNCWLALAQLRNGDSGAAKDTLESSLEWLGGEGDERAQIYCVLASIAFGSGGVGTEDCGADVAGTKNLLFKSITTKVKIPNSLTALCALGMLTSDDELINLVIQEMKELVKAGNRDLVADVVFFKACHRVIRGDENGGLKELARGIHSYPMLGTLWRHLCLFLLQFSPEQARVAANAAEVAALVTPRDRKSLALATLGHLMAGRHDVALRCAQRSCFLYPDSVNNWCALVGAAFPSCSGTGLKKVDNEAKTSGAVGKLEVLKRILGFLRQYSKGKVERELSAWLLRYDRKIDALMRPASVKS